MNKSNSLSGNQSRWTILFTLAALLGLAVPQATAATFLWNPPTNLTDTNWSNGNNWSNLTANTTGTVPGSGDFVRFLDAGAVGTNGFAGTNVINSYLDTSLTFGSFQFGQTNGNHGIAIANGATMYVGGSLSNFIVGTFNDPNSSTQQENIVIKGAGGTLFLTNNAGVLYIAQGRSANTNGTLRSTLDMTGLDNFTAYENRIQVGERGNGVNIQNATGTLLLAKTNFIQLYASVGTAYTNLATANATYAIGVGENDGNTGGNNLLYLGLTNAFFVDGIAVGRNKTTSSILFNPNFTNSNPVAYVRGTNGNSSRVTFITVGDMQSTGSSSSQAAGTMDFSNGTIDFMVDTLSLARDRSGGNTGAGATVGTFTFTSGTLDVNTLLAGNQAYATTGNINPMQGRVNVLGSSAKLVVNTVLVLGKTTTNSTASLSAAGVLYVRNGTVMANSITAGVFNTNSVIGMTNGTLIITNNMGSLTKGITLFAITNSTLQLNLTTGNNNYIVVSNLVTGGTTNMFNFPAVPVFTSYPKQVVLIRYSGTGSIGGAGYNFGFAGALPASAPGAYLSNNVANKTIDLVLPYDPRPVITSQPVGFAGGPGSSVTLSAVVDLNSVTPLTFQWYNGTTPITNGLTANNSTFSGATTATLQIGNAQIPDSGSYTVAITNTYGGLVSGVTPASPASVTISTNPIPPTILGLTSQTVVQGTNLTFVTAVNGYLAPTLQWQENGIDIPGQTSQVLILTNVQYSQNGYVYSLIASNDAAITTNSATLTVIVAPTISVQPANLTVTNSQAASFSVTAAGIPNPTYQWNKNGTPIASAGNPSATNATLNIASASPSDIATYTVKVQNSAGSVTSSNATLAVNSTMIIASLSPANGSSGIGYDTPLYISFDRLVLLRAAGKIRIYNSTNNTTPVDTIDLSLNAINNTQAHSTFSGDNNGFVYFPVITNGTLMAIYPHGGVMTSNQTYYVTIDNGVFTDSTGAYFAGITNSLTWSFTTKPAGPANPRNMVVAVDGSGDFVTLQGAIDSLPAGNTNFTVINVHDGNYVEIVNISGKHNLSIRGQSRSGTLVGYANNNNMNPGTHIRMAFKVNANDIEIENLTITNRTVIGGSQAEALMLESGAARFILNNAALGSYQDTLLANVNSSQGYFNNCLISGAFDYIWGGGNLFFTNCEIRTLVNANGVLNNGNVTAARTDNGPSGNWPAGGGLFSANGFSFVNCRFTRDSNGIVNTTLAGNNGTPNGVVSWIGCSFDANYVVPVSAVLNAYLLWEYGNSNLDNTTPKSFGLATGTLSGPALTPSDARYLAAYNSVSWLNNWAQAPVFTSQPANTVVPVGTSATFTASVSSSPNPAYQWLQNGTNLPGATKSSLTISNAPGSASGYIYAVTVSAPGGSITSTNATLAVALPPVAPDVTDNALEGFGGAVDLGASSSVGLTLHYGFVGSGATNYTTARGGTIIVDASGHVVYSNSSDFNGSESVPYYVTDGFNYTTGTVTVAVAFVNDLRPAVFTNGVSYGTITNPIGLAIADYTGDKKLDAVLVSGSTNLIEVWRGNGTGALSSASAVVSAGVLHGNGARSAFGAAGLAGTVSNLVVVSAPGNLDTNAWVDILKHTAGTFTVDASLRVGTGAVAAAAGPLAGKGIAALAVGGTHGSDGFVQIWRKTGTAASAGWTNSATRVLAGTPVHAVAIGNAAGNTNLDVVVAAGADKVIVLTGNGNGTLALGQTDYTVGAGPVAVTVADVNNDSVADVVTANATSDDISVLTGTNNAGTVTLTSGGSYGVGEDVGWSPSALGLADLNRDGRLDAVVTLSGVDAIMVLQGQNSASLFRFLWEDSDVFFGVGATPTAVAFGDLNADSSVDAVVANSASADVTVLLNNYTPMTSGSQTLGLLEDHSKSLTLRGSAGPLDYWLTKAPTNGSLTGADIALGHLAGSYLVLATNQTGPITLSYQGSLNAYGKDLFQYVVWDGVKTSLVATISLTITNVNDAPTFNLATNPVTVGEDSGQTTIGGAVTNITAGAANEKDTESFVLTLDNPAQSNLFKVKPVLDKTGKLTFTVAGNQFGTAVVNVVETDTGGTLFGGVNTTTGNFAIRIVNSNDAPVISTLKNLTLNEGDLTNLTVTLTDLETPPGLLTLEASVDKPEFFPGGIFTEIAPSIHSGLIDLTRADGNETNGQWNMELRPAVQAYGKVTITLSAADPQHRAATNRSAVLTLNAVNDAPSYTVEATALTTGNTASLLTNSLLVASHFDLGDGNTFETNQSLKFFVVGNDNAALFSKAPAVSTNGVLSFVLKGGHTIGTATFKIYAQDNLGKGNGGKDLSVTNLFTVTVTNVLDTPDATNLLVSTKEDVVANITLKGTNYDSFDATYDPGLRFFIVGGPSYGTLNTTSLNRAYTNANPTVGYTPNANFNGADLFQYRVYTDKYTSAVATVSITVTALNDKPTFTLSTNAVDAGTNGAAITRNGFAADPSAGAADEADTLTFVLTGYTAGNFTAAPVINSAGVLTFTPKAGKIFTNTVTVVLKDNGSPALSSTTTNFTLLVFPNGGH